MTQHPGDDPVDPASPPAPASEPPVYGTPAPDGPAPPPPPPPPGYAAPGYGPPPPAPEYGQAPPTVPGYGQPPPGPNYGQAPPPTSSWGRPGGAPGPRPPNGGLDERQLVLFAHLGGVLAIFPIVHLIPALVIYLLFQSRSEIIRDQAREALNFQIVVLIAFFAARILNVLPLFPNLVPLVWVFSLVFSVIAAVAASRGTRYRYPLTYRFLH